ncbi:hypothetical protein VV404_004611 [Salmonella enterica]|nr:hypothetical protein [Salmonella enterica]EMD7527400.1 hypothetical protein [Salmonella enterica]
MNSYLVKLSLVITMLGVSCAVSAVGIPIVDLSAPIKISESSSYSCDESGNALDEGKPMRYKNQTVTCRNNNLWVEGKALTFMDLTTDFMNEAIKIKSKNEKQED